MKVPVWAWVVAGFGIAFVLGPLIGLLTSTDWATIGRALASGTAVQALWLTAGTAAAATVLSAALGVPTALALARCRPRLAGALRAVGLIPLVMPPMVSGVALLSWFGQAGLAGRVLGVFGLSIPYTTLAVVIAQTFVAWPFLVVAIEAGLRSADRRLEMAAASLGASPSHVLATITLPQLWPALRGGLVLCFARAVGEYGATIMLAGNKPGHTQTMSLAIYSAYNSGADGQTIAIALSVVMVMAAVVLLAAAGQFGLGDRR